jgi:hypothetical protein
MYCEKIEKLIGLINYLIIKVFLGQLMDSQQTIYEYILHRNENIYRYLIEKNKELKEQLLTVNDKIKEKSIEEIIRKLTEEISYRQEIIKETKGKNR